MPVTAWAASSIARPYPVELFKEPMSALARPLRRLAPSTLAVLALAFAACATAEEPQSDDDDDYVPSGGSGGTGGAAGSAGAPSVGTAGKAPTTTGGTPSTTTGGQTGGGGTTGTAGTTATGGTTGTAGASTGTCPPYTGTLAKDSDIFMGGFGKSTTGTWSGYGYTYKYGTATITPGMGNSCFAGAKLCANGSVPADDKSGAGLGWNIGQAVGATATTKVPITTPVTLKFAGVTTGMRVQLSASSAVSYCYTLTDAEITAGTATIPYASFKTACWDAATAMAYDGVVAIEAIQIAVPGSTAGAAKTFDFCLLDVEPG